MKPYPDTLFFQLTTEIENPKINNEKSKRGRLNLNDSLEEMLEQSQIEFEENTDLFIYPKRKRVSSKALVVKQGNENKDVLPSNDWFDKLLSQDMDEWNGKTKEQTILRLAAHRQERLFAYLENQQKLETLLLKR